jgi:glycosyltransferase involved in cell wall biosynthesis
MRLEIAFVTETFPPEVNGVAMTVGRLVHGMRERGHRIDVIRPRQGEADAGGEHETALPGFPLPAIPACASACRPAPAGPAVAPAPARPGPCRHRGAARLVGGGHRAPTRHPVTSGFHTNFDRYSVHYGLGWMRPAVAAYLRTLHRRTQATMVPTEALAADLAGEGIAGVRVVGRGVDNPVVRPGPAQRRAARRLGRRRRRAGLPVRRPAGRREEPRAGEQAYAGIRAVRPDSRLVWVGEGPQRAALAARHPDQHFAGMRTGEELAAHYASADLFLFPSLTETYGNVVAEAMASGLAVLAYRSAAAAELIVSGQNGVSVAPGDAAAFVEAAAALAGEAGRLPVLGAAARAAMLPRSWEHVVERFERVAREALGG